MRNWMQTALSTLMILLGCSATAVACSKGADHVRPLDRVAREVKALLHNREFSKLDTLAHEYKTRKSLTSDGQPKLMGFYAGTSNSASNCQGVAGMDKDWETHKLLLQQWSNSAPESVAAKLSLARFETAYGWYARGIGYASTVSEEGWQLFRKRIGISRALLEQIASVASDDPAWHEGMLSIALAQGWERAQFDALYQTAVQRFPHHLAYYFTKGSFYSAKWHGSQNAFKAFVDEAVQNTEREMGQTMYARLNWSAQENNMFINGKTDWPRMKLGFETMIKHFPDAWNHNNFAKFACMAGDKKTLIEQMGLINRRLAITAWGSKQYLSACEQWATGSAENKV